jgi:transposase
MERTTFIGLDVSKQTIAVAVALDEAREPTRYLGRFPNTPDALRRLCKKLHQDGRELHFCYEAGPFGYALHRRLERWGHRCDVIAPSLIPSRPGDRVKTDRRDALTLAAALRAGQLTAVWVPDTTHEAIRSLVRLGRTVADDVRRAKQQIIGFCFVHERIYDGKSSWTRSHRRWLVEQTFDHEALAFVFSELLMRLEKAEGFRERVRAELAQTIQEWALYPVVEAIQALRGFGWENAAIVVAEIGDIRRFATAPQFMAYLGLTPSEASSGGTRRRGGITKAGNGLARTALVEAAWTYRFPARFSHAIRQRSAALPEPLRDKAWAAQVRLCRRSRAFAQRGMPSPKIVTAIARELAGFLWAIARMVQPNMA